MCDMKSSTRTVPHSLGTDGNQRIDRRLNGRSGGSPMDILTQLPAVVVLERIPVPTLAVAREGTILFANTAFAEMVGYRQDSLAGLAFSEIFYTALGALDALSRIDAPAKVVVELQHREGWTVRTEMSKSALIRCADPIVLVTFENLTERLWDKGAIGQVSRWPGGWRSGSRARNSRK